MPLMSHKKIPQFLLEAGLELGFISQIRGVPRIPPIGA